MGCGSALEAAPTSAPDIERKVITALFCDVVGSTELAERLDPEDVDRLLRTYHALARRQIEAHGGTLEKFIGDAVLGVFGAPTAHEDDAARAVRASLRIIRDLSVSGLELHVRIGLHTGEAVVRVGQDRFAEEGLATGATLNTAARLQNAAPIDGIVVSEQTYRRTQDQFDWQDLGQVSVKGKAQPLQIWQPIPRVAAATAAHAEATPFLGRDWELGTLMQAFERAIGSSSVELVTIVADAGMGKSRIVRELARGVAERSPDAVWRSGRCLPYGDGISLWALGEIVKSNAGILETDDQASIARKLNTSVRDSDPELRRWLLARLAPLVGLQTDSAPPRQEEAFAAWRRFLLSLASDGPAVVVIEDLHWADAALVAFLIDFVQNAAGVPILLVVTARPEVADRHPGFLERARQSIVVQLVSLGDDAITALVESTLAGASPELVYTVLERAAGSPLYAEQLAALVREQGLSVTDATLDASVIPPTIQALLAARIDALPRELKPPLLDASVIGRVFWSGAVATLAHTPEGAVEPALADLLRRELTRSREPSTMLGEDEYGFWHGLLRDVAYSFLPRAARLAKHRAAAKWITDRVGGEVGDLAEIVADHLRQALQLADATGAVDEVPAISAELATSLLAAAAHAMWVEPGRAIAQLEEALGRLGDDDSRRGKALLTLADALEATGDDGGASRLYAEAQHWRLARGDAVGAAEMAVVRGRVLSRIGEDAQKVAIFAEARETLESSPGPGLITLLTEEALDLEGHRSEYPRIIALADRAIALARQLELPEPPRALFARATSKLALGDRSAEAEIRRAIGLALASGNLRDALIGYLRIGGALTDIATPSEALAVYDEALGFARDHGLNVRGVLAQRLDTLDLAGRWDEILAEVPVLRDMAIAAGDEWGAWMAAMMEIGVNLARGEPTPPLDTIERDAAAVGFPPSIAQGILGTAAMNRGDEAEAHACVERAFEATPGDQAIFGLLDLVWIAERVGDADLARRLVTKGVPPGPTSRGLLSTLAAALVAEAAGELEEATRLYAEATLHFAALQRPWNHAFGLAGLGRCSLAAGDRAAGMAELHEAREIAAGLRAAPLVSDIDSALATAAAD
jgi:class 3 adenylate cyclase/tetratricopeptide (TPR) repeat protein